MPESPTPLRNRIRELLARTPRLKATEIAQTLGSDRREVNRCLTYELAGHVHQGRDYRWSLVGQVAAQPDVPAPTTDLSRLCRYYLECISQDMDAGVSVFASARYEKPNYAALPSVPIGTDSAWWNAPEVGQLLGTIRAERGKLMPWLGYPVRLRKHRTPRWEGFFVEPVLLWPITVPDAIGADPSIDPNMPMLNTKFLRSVAMGDSWQLAEESARLADELGLAASAEDFPDIEDLAERLVRIRPDWDWQEPLDPNACGALPSIADITQPGVYNRAVIVPGERSPFTVGLESELKALGNLPPATVSTTALGRWLSVDAQASDSLGDESPLLEVLPMNTEQRQAVRVALSSPHTVVTGPPGTGKSQVVTNLLVNAAWRGMKVLFASKNNKAVDVVEARVNGLGNRPVLLRLGAQAFQARLATYLTQMLAGSPGPEVQESHDEGLRRHRQLAAQLAELDQTQQRTLESRNEVDRLDEGAQAARKLLGDTALAMTPDSIAHLQTSAEALAAAVDGIDRSRQTWLMRLLWPLVGRGRHERLRGTAVRAGSALAAVGISWPDEQDDGDVALFRERLSEVRSRIAGARTYVRYKEALVGLQSLPSFEDIARRRRELTDEVSANSTRLWRDWVNLSPLRLSAAQRRDVADYTAVLQALTGPDAERVNASVKRRAKELQSRISSLFSCWAVTSLSARGRVPMEPGHFDLVIIDEASQCDIASALPLLYRAKRSVIIGDPMQLRHISALTHARDSELQAKHDLVDTRLGWMYSTSSLFDVATSFVPPEGIVNLRDHHRSHADIIGFSNETFYEGRLRVATRHPRLNRPNARQPGVVWQHVVGKVVRPAGGGARNLEEAHALVAALHDLLVERDYRGTVGVVTPFRAQAELLQELVQSQAGLREAGERAELLVDTVHKFQGDERDVMFFSPVVSVDVPAGALSFLRGNGNLFNVAITRARGLLHVVGDRGAAGTSGVEYLEKFSAYVSELDVRRAPSEAAAPASVSREYPTVMHPERVSDWERRLYVAMVDAGLKPIPQFSVEQYDLDFAMIAGDRKLAIEVDGERYHRSWTGELTVRDQLRNMRLIELGWDVRRFWVYEVRDQLDACVAALVAWMKTEPEGRSARGA